VAVLICSSITGDIPIAVANSFLITLFTLFSVFIFNKYGKLSIISWPNGFVLIAVIAFSIAIFVELYFVFLDVMNMS
jgi:hypothetical protein